MSDDDKMAFIRAMQGVKKLEDDKRSMAKRPVKPLYHRQDEQQLDDFVPPPLSDHNEMIVSGDEKIEFFQSGLPEKLLRRLKRGRIRPQARLDLHGFTVQQAEIALFRFLSGAQGDSQVCVLVIHGKGRDTKAPILKNRITCWLQQSPIVLAFCSAIPPDGGAGATYVLLKKGS